jgi:hypothetical protein
VREIVSRPVGSAGTDLAWTRVSHHRRQIFIDKGTIKMTDNINPSHYKDGPFECIELSRLLSSDWGQAVQYCFRWQHKNGVEDLKKALWFVNDALVHGIPIYAVSDWADLASALFHTLAREDWAGLKSVWDAFTVWHRGDIPGLLKDKINEIEKEGK